MEGRFFEPVSDNVDAAGHPAGTSWLVCRLEESRFEALGGALDLGKMMRIFRDWVAST